MPSIHIQTYDVTSPSRISRTSCATFPNRATSRSERGRSRPLVLCLTHRVGPRPTSPPTSNGTPRVTPPAHLPGHRARSYTVGQDFSSLAFTQNARHHAKSTSSRSDKIFGVMSISSSNMLIRIVAPWYPVVSRFTRARLVPYGAAHYHTHPRLMLATGHIWRGMRAMLAPEIC